MYTHMRTYKIHVTKNFENFKWDENEGETCYIQNKDSDSADVSLETTHNNKWMDKWTYLFPLVLERKMKAAANVDFHSQGTSFQKESQGIFRETIGKKINSVRTDLPCNGH